MIRTLLLALALLTMPNTPHGPAAAPAAPSGLAELLDRCGDDYARVVEVVLGDTGLWWRQRQIARSLADHHTTLVPAGNSVGKSYSVARLILAWLFRHKDGLAVTTAPTLQQLDGVLWKEMRRAHRGSALPLGGRFTRSPLCYSIRDEWKVIGLSSDSVEAMSGQHAEHLLFVADEASGVEEAKFEAANSWNPSRRLLIGNPLRPTGKFFELCRQAEGGSNPQLNLIRIPSTESPHAHLDRSPVGMADRTFLESMRLEYGERSIWYLAHILARFPGDVAEVLIRSAWLDLAEKAIHQKAGPTRTAIDLGGGHGGGDPSVVLTRDDNGILAMEWSAEWPLETTAAVAANQVRRFGVHPARVSFDRGGLGEDFANRLTAVGLGGARPYLGGSGGGKTATNLRSAAARQAKRRLDPGHLARSPSGHLARSPSGLLTPQVPFAIPREFLAVLRRQLLELRYVLADGDGSIFALERKEDMAARLRCSPDFADAFIQSFAFPG